MRLWRTFSRRWGRRLSRALLALLLGLTHLPAATAGRAEGEIWLLVDTVAQRLDVYRDNTALVRFRNIAIGSGGTAWVRREGDHTTPLGEFRINRINRDSRFHIFLGLDYPNQGHVERAFEAGFIDSDTYGELLASRAVTGNPLQTTALGGNIGIHGIGQGDPEIHAQYNWTRGCIALTNEQIEQLARLIGIGTRVLIR